MPTPGPDMQVRVITAAQTYPLRQSVLRAGLPPEACIFPGDDDPATTHLGVVRGDDLLAIATLMREPLPVSVPDPAASAGDLPAGALPDAQACRLRGMAVAPEVRGQGIGAALLRACFAHAWAAGATRFWCNARTPAVPFYERHGLRTSGGEFDIPTAGPHRLMYRDLRRETLPSV